MNACAIALIIASFIPTTPLDDPPPPVVVFIGDSYSFDGDTTRWPALLSAARGWTEVNLSYPGIGYTVPGDGLNYITAIPLAVAANPDLVIVSGGRNDLGLETDPDWHIAVGLFYQQLRAELPGVAIYGVSPIWDDDPPPAGLLTIRTRVAQSVTAAGGCPVDIGHPLQGHPEWIGADGIHPNLAGRQMLAALHDSLLPAPDLCDQQPRSGYVPLPI